MKRLLTILTIAFLTVSISGQTKKPAQQKKTTTQQKASSSQKKTAAKPTSKKSSKGAARSGSAASSSSKKKGKGQATPTTNEIKGLQNQRATIQKKIKEQERLLQANKASVKERLNTLLVINSEIGQRQKSIEEIQKDINSIEGNIDLLKTQLETLEQQLDERKEKYIKSLRLCDRFVYDEDHSKGTLTQYVSDNEDNGDALYKADCGLYPDSDGYYTFKINVPFRDGSVILDLADIPAKLHTVTLAESEDVVSGDQYDKDGGILLFSNFSGESSKNVNAGDTVSTAVIPYTGYTCKGLEIKDASGAEASRR